MSDVVPVKVDGPKPNPYEGTVGSPKPVDKKDKKEKPNQTPGTKKVDDTKLNPYADSEKLSLNGSGGSAMKTYVLLNDQEFTV